MSEEAGALGPEAMRALACALDEIVPPSSDGRLPGAGEAGLAEALAAQPDLRPALLEGLALLDELARGRGAGGFVDLAPGDHRAVLEETVERAPGFLPGITAQTFVAYYQVPRVRETLDLQTRPPYPEGYAVEPTDFSILDPVRARERFYRER